MHAHVATLLERNILCKAWSSEGQSELAHKCALYSVEKGTSLFAQGQPATHFYLLLAGRVHLGLRTPSGYERVISTYEGPTSFGELYMLMQKNFPLGAYADTDCALAAVPFSAFVGVLARHEQALEQVLALLSNRLFVSAGELNSGQQSFMSGTQRVLMYLLSRMPLRNGATYELEHSKANIAQLLNLTPEHFSRILHDLSKRGFIKVQGRWLTLSNVDGLCAYKR